MAASLAASALCAQTTYKACNQAREKLAIPESVHIIAMCQTSPEVRPALSLLFSENGIDVYRLEYPTAGNAAKSGPGPQSGHTKYPFTERALLVYQDEKARITELNKLVQGGMNWYDQWNDENGTLQTNWNSIASFKYETVEFQWLNKSYIQFRRLDAFAPPECVTKISPNVQSNVCGSPNVKSNALGFIASPSAPPLDQNAFPFLYKVAVALASDASAQSDMKENAQK